MRISRITFCIRNDISDSIFDSISSTITAVKRGYNNTHLFTISTSNMALHSSGQISWTFILILATELLSRYNTF